MNLWSTENVETKMQHCRTFVGLGRKFLHGTARLTFQTKKKLHHDWLLRQKRQRITNVLTFSGHRVEPLFIYLFCQSCLFFSSDKQWRLILHWYRDAEKILYIFKSTISVKETILVECGRWIKIRVLWQLVAIRLGRTFLHCQSAIHYILSWNDFCSMKLSTRIRDQFQKLFQDVAFTALNVDLKN